MILSDFLDAKPLYYDVIDYDRMPRTYGQIKDQMPLPKVIHMVGTNGKGTTGRFIANALYRAGYDVGHYTSPHIITFNERIWRNGSLVADATLETAHQKLLSMLGDEAADALSYFEYTTLLGMVVYASCDWVVLEAGLGGEYDATNVFEKVLSVFTPVGMDHEAFLGDTIEAIATTKLRSMGKCAVMGKQPHQEVYGVYDTIADLRNTGNHRVQDILKDADYRGVERIASHLNMPEYLQENLQLAIAALKVLGISYDVAWFEAPILFGRMSTIAPNVIVDVGHNVLAAEALCRALYPQKVVLVYNSFKDKAYTSVLQSLKPVIQRVEILDIEDERAVERSQLEAALASALIPYDTFRGITPERMYLVFGSFSVVEAFMRREYA